MKPLKLNVIANIVGKGWMAVLALVLVPMYLRMMGPEAYGLVGFAATLQAACCLLDMGLSGTVNRELARLAHVPDSASEMRNLVRTTETLYWPVAIAIALVTGLGSGFIATRWLHVAHLSPDTVQRAILLIGITIAMQFPQAFYLAALAGIERQVALNAALVVGMTFRGVLTVLVLRHVSPSIITFFIAQIAGNALLTLCTAAMLWRDIPRSNARARFERRLLVQLKSFIAGMAGIIILVAILTQMDNFAVSHLRPLAEFGYYTLAASVSYAPYVLSGAVNSALVPRFTAAVSARDQTGIEALYHRGAQALTVSLLPLSVSGALFSREFILAWTGNPTTVAHTHLILSFMLVGAALHAVLYVPLALQVACGWPQFSAVAYSIGLTIFLPVTFFLTSRFGSPGAPFGWIGLNAAIVVFGIPVMHRRLLPSAKRAWYLIDLGIPTLATLAAGIPLRLALPISASRSVSVVRLVVAVCVTGAAAAAATPLTRELVGKGFTMARGRIRAKADL